MTLHCPACNRTLWHDELNICRRCEATTAAHLRELPRLFQQADQTAALFKTRNPDAAGSGQPSQTSPVKLAALDLTANGGAVTRLQAIEDSWRQTLGWTMGETRQRTDIAGVTTFLINNLRWACEEYDEIAADLKSVARLHSQLSNVLTGEPPARRFDVYCSTNDCAGVMNITLFTRTAACPACANWYDHVELRQLRSEFDEPAQPAA